MEIEKQSRQSVDWDQVAVDYRAGVLTDRQIGAKHGRSYGSIQQYAKKHGIERDLSDRITQRTKAKLVKAQLVKSSSQANNGITQEHAIEVAAEAGAMVVIAQQGRIGRHLSISGALIAELESQTIDRELYDKLGELMFSPDKNGVDRLNYLYQKAISTASRIDSHKKAVETEKTLIGLERQVFGIDAKDDGAGNSAIESVIKRVLEKRSTE